MQIWYEVQVQSSEDKLAAAFYLKMGQCKFGPTCKFHHPKDIQIPSAEQENKIGEIGTTIQLEGTGFAVKPPALSFNSKGLPVSPGEPDCPFYLKTGSCKYGASWARLKRTEKAH
ncbi:zinc finger CCCH domain-containing protein 37 isoform X3 [Prunus persica]|uniref:zinc finger CCCH domain-containing protein 37 isoform X3 n=1 Tax=Prunus persica TaxID=3760 RepID=UPI0009AB751B|nr:zinc finger CCCH domain-containing protein 37 isoform X3 [Prunus persica]